jgi:hypothetical protein
MLQLRCDNPQELNYYSFHGVNEELTASSGPERAFSSGDS